MVGYPWITVSAQMHDHVMHLTGTPARKFYWDAATMVSAFEKVSEYYGMDFFRTVGDAYNFEVEAMGAKMVYSDFAMPTVDFREPLVREPADLLKLKAPNFRRDGRIPYALECMRLTGLKEKGTKQGYFCAPFSMAVALRSFPGLIKDMRRRPQFVRDLLDFIVAYVTIPYLRVQKEYAEVTRCVGVDAWATMPNLSAEELMEWAVPWSKQVREEAKKFDVVASCANGDYCEEQPERFDIKVLHQAFDIQLASLGAPTFFLGMGQWHEYPLQPVLDYTMKFRVKGIRVPLSASVNARLLRDGPVEKIVDTVKRYISTFAPDHELAVSLANIPADTNPDHVHAAVAAVHTYGRKPLAKDLEKLEFVLPKRESFQEWVLKRTDKPGKLA